jgi:subtilisin family serine protease
MVTASAPGVPAISAPAAGPPVGSFVVLFKAGTTAATKAQALGATPRFVYRSAVSGFAADLSQAQLDQLSVDPSVVMVADAHWPAVPASSAAPAVAPVKQTKQVVPAGVRRVGALGSRTASIRGRGKNLRVGVAVFDGGLERKHPDLNVAGGTSCNGGTAFEPVSNHGTMVAGVVGARDNKFGVVGVAPGTPIWSVRVHGPAGYGDRAQVLCGVDWVTRHRDRIKVANMSFTVPGQDDGACGRINRDPVHFGVCASVARGVTYVAAAGNRSIDTASVVPASWDEVIAASALSDSDGQPGGLGGPTCQGSADDRLAPFSNFGPDIDIAAPGVCVLTTIPGRAIGTGDGTSFSAPLVAGAAALYLTRHPKASPTQVKAALLDARQQIPLPGDPDGIAEGVLNVSSF